MNTSWWRNVDAPRADSLGLVVIRPVRRSNFTLITAESPSTWNWSTTRRNRREGNRVWKEERRRFKNIMKIRYLKLYIFNFPSQSYVILPSVASTALQVAVKPESTTLSLEEKLMWSVFPSLTMSAGGTWLQWVPEVIWKCVRSSVLGVHFIIKTPPKNCRYVFETFRADHMWHHYLFSAMPGKLINGTLLHSKKGLFEYIFYLNKVLVPVCLMPWFFSTWWLYNWVPFWKWKLLVGVKGFSFICYRSVGIFTWVEIYLSTLGFWLPCMLCRCSIFFSLTNFRFYPDITNDQTLDIIMIGYITVTTTRGCTDCAEMSALVSNMERRQILTYPDFLFCLRVWLCHLGTNHSPPERNCGNGGEPICLQALECSTGTGLCCCRCQGNP